MNALMRNGIGEKWSSNTLRCMAYARAIVGRIVARIAGVGPEDVNIVVNTIAFDHAGGNYHA